MVSALLFNSCEEDEKDALNYISFEATDFDFGVELDGTTVIDFKVYTANSSSSDRTFNIKIDTETSTLDSGSYTMPTTVVVPANTNVGLLPISISDINIGEEGEILVIKFIPSEGLYTGDAATLNVKQVCPLNEVNLSITFDDWPDETAWELLDSENNILHSADYDTYIGETDFSKAFCLPNGIYTFIIYDYYEDGTGNYQLIYNDTILASGGDFGYTESTTFSVSL